MSQNHKNLIQTFCKMHYFQDIQLLPDFFDTLYNFLAYRFFYLKKLSAVPVKSFKTSIQFYRMSKKITWERDTDLVLGIILILASWARYVRSTYRDHRESSAFSRIVTDDASCTTRARKPHWMIYLFKAAEDGQWYEIRIWHCQRYNNNKKLSFSFSGVS